MEDNYGVVIPLLRGFPGEMGTVRRLELRDSTYFIVLVEDNPSHGDTGFGVYSILLPFVRSRIIKMVGIDGWFGEVDTIWFRVFPDAEVRKEVGEYFTKRIDLRGAELASIVTEGEFELWGADDKELYQRALRLWITDQLDEFLRIERARAVVMLGNLLRRMKENDQRVAGLTVGGNLPDYVSDEMGRRGLSYAVIRPRGFKYGSALQAATLSSPSEREKAVCCNVLMAAAVVAEEGELNSCGGALALDKFGYPSYDPAIVADLIEEGQSLFYKGSYQAAIPSFEKAARVLKTLWYSRRRTAEALASATKAEGRRKDQNAGEALPTSPIAVPRDEGNMLKLEKAEEQAKRCSEFASIVEHNLAVALERTGKHDEASLHWDKAVEINPENDHAWSSKAANMGLRGQYEEAIRCCDKAISINPRNPEPWYNKFATLTRLGRTDEAHECYQKFEKLGGMGAVLKRQEGRD